MAKDIAAIHVLKAQLQLTGDDYRALLRNLTGLDSCKAMSPQQLHAVRGHLDGLVRRSRGEAVPPARRMTAERFQKAKAQATPKERKVWALWGQLGRDGKLRDATPRGLNVWISRQVGVSALSFCNGAQLDTLIEALKAWQERGHGSA